MAQMSLQGYEKNLPHLTDESIMPDGQLKTHIANLTETLNSSLEDKLGRQR